VAFNRILRASFVGIRHQSTSHPQNGQVQAVSTATNVEEARSTSRTSSLSSSWLNRFRVDDTGFRVARTLD
jgi:hypothetical protein